LINHFYLSLGSNIQPEQNLPAAVRLISRFGEIVAASTVYESRPLGGAAQPNYLNAAVWVRSPLAPEAFQTLAIGTVEMELGRVRTADRFAPRTIDIDILLCNDETRTIGHRAIPRAEILAHDFVAVPLGEIAPDKRHPVTGQTLGEIASQWGARPRGLIPRPDVRLISEG